MRLTVSTNARQVAMLLTDVGRKQLPFATARALTKLAQASQSDVRDEMPGKFTLRNRFTQQEVRITPATKTHLQATIGSSERSGYMQRQQDGGMRYPIGRHLAVPLDTSKKIPPGQRPKALLDKTGYFKGKAGKAGKLGIWKRQIKKLTLIYRLIDRASIKPRYEIDQTVEHAIGRDFDHIMQQSLDDAFRTAR
jgi:hypothetical protein